MIIEIIAFTWVGSAIGMSGIAGYAMVKGFVELAKDAINGTSQSADDQLEDDDED